MFCMVAKYEVSSVDLGRLCSERRRLRELCRRRFLSSGVEASSDPPRRQLWFLIIKMISGSFGYVRVGVARFEGSEKWKRWI